jgi:hypothetical protein
MPSQHSRHSTSAAAHPPTWTAYIEQVAAPCTNSTDHVTAQPQPTKLAAYGTVRRARLLALFPSPRAALKYPQSSLIYLHHFLQATNAHCQFPPKPPYLPRASFVPGTSKLCTHTQCKLLAQPHIPLRGPITTGSTLERFDWMGGWCGIVVRTTLVAVAAGILLGKAGVGGVARIWLDGGYLK